MALFRIFTSIHQVDTTDWQRRLASRYPFLCHAFLAALEDSASIGGDSGWQPMYLLSDELALPCFIKQHSYGEYVFDWSWAEAYERHGLDYYPKLLCAAPFTPATGPRLLSQGKDISAEQLQAALEALAHLCQRHNWSGWHLNFFQPSQQALLQQQDCHVRIGCQFHWRNRDYATFDEFLQTFTSRKRKNVNKERKKVQQQLTLTRLTGDDIRADDIHQFYQCYQLTYLKRYSRGYLNEAFFQQLRTSMAEQLLLVRASENDKPVAYALYLFDDTTLYGRYWGSLDNYDGLHFEACYYQGIEFCIEHQLQRFDPGTQGEHKISRGFEPTLTYSAHWLRQPEFHTAVGNFCEEEAEHVRRYQADAATLLPFRADT
ncbi:GNAT family N-acetyltransferase [Bacterioplanes sanyensis]|uniref:GNAT family N-acetyltransferase n=1 Tax=Bacterioplanes sanyensis TaxID=1249553 RepID=A0A222FKL8_9GAMM|nr:GNAT family N-acetyltransferase [Bacterioplanes sanyensis]ASP39558.1 GNAT family N-acetyltransferase [Bacterioplanes sanyensis]